MFDPRGDNMFIALLLGLVAAVQVKTQKYESEANGRYLLGKIHKTKLLIGPLKKYFMYVSSLRGSIN